MNVGREACALLGVPQGHSRRGSFGLTTAPESGAADLGGSHP